MTPKEINELFDDALDADIAVIRESSNNVLDRPMVMEAIDRIMIGNKRRAIAIHAVSLIPHKKLIELTINAVARAFLQASEWIQLDEDKMILEKVHEAVSHSSIESIMECCICPVCEESQCDEGCALEDFRKLLINP